MSKQRPKSTVGGVQLYRFTTCQYKDEAERIAEGRRDLGLVAKVVPITETYRGQRKVVGYRVMEGAHGTKQARRSGSKNPRLTR